MCLSGELLATLCFGLVPLFANILLFFTTPFRPHVRFDGSACMRIVGKSLLLTIPVAGTIMLLQNWLPEGGKVQICFGRGIYLTGAFVLALLLTIATAGHEQIKSASGVNVAAAYRGRFMLLLVALALIFFLLRVSLGAVFA